MNLQELENWAEIGKISGKEVSVKCPFHNDSNPSMSVNTETWLYYCFTCGAKGCLADSEEIPESTFRLLNSLLTKIDDFRDKTEETKIVGIPNEYIRIKEDSVYLDYLLNRGISFPTICNFKLGYCTKGYYADRIIFPISGNGFVARTIHSDPIVKLFRVKKRYVYPKGFNVSAFLYNDLNHQNCKILVEGVFDVLKLHEFGFNATATLGCILHENQISKLVKSNIKELIFAFDGDDAGRLGAEQSAEKISHYFPSVSFVELPAGKDPSDLKNDEWKQVFENRESYPWKSKMLFEMPDFGKLNVY